MHHGVSLAREVAAPAEIGDIHVATDQERGGQEKRIIDRQEKRKMVPRAATHFARKGPKIYTFVASLPSFQEHLCTNILCSRSRFFLGSKELGP